MLIMLALLVENIFLTTFYGLYFNHQLHIILHNYKIKFIKIEFLVKSGYFNQSEHYDNPRLIAINGQNTVKGEWHGCYLLATAR